MDKNWQTDENLFLNEYVDLLESSGYSDFHNDAFSSGHNVYCTGKVGWLDNQEKIFISLASSSISESKKWGILKINYSKRFYKEEVSRVKLEKSFYLRYSHVQFLIY